MKSPTDARVRPVVGNEEMITWAYRLFLDREPESRQAVKALSKLDNTSEVRRLFQDSVEYRDRNAAIVRDVRSKDRQIVESHATIDESNTICAFVGSVWQQLGREMPHWSVLSSDQFKPDRIARNEEEFFNSGAIDLDILMAAFERNGIDFGGIGHAVEFGCGLGRVTKFLAPKVSLLTAIDISTSHLAFARQYVGPSKGQDVAFVQARFPDFGHPDAYDLWLSRIVLQHNPPPIIRMILTRALTGLRSGGIAVFQVPTYATGYTFTVRQYIASLHQRACAIEMHCLPMEDVFRIVWETQCIPIEVMGDASVSDPGWVSTQFVIRKR